MFYYAGVSSREVIPDDKFRASSQQGYLYRSSNGRLNSQQVIGDSAGSWCAEYISNSQKHWVQVDLGRNFIVSKISTQGNLF